MDLLYEGQRLLTTLYKAYRHNLCSIPFFCYTYKVVAKKTNEKIWQKSILLEWPDHRGGGTFRDGKFVLSCDE